jgi:thiol reductant ABC exporter CydD subunit
MRAVDPRLLRFGRETRHHLAVSILLGGLTAVLVIAQAWLLADVVAGAFSGDQSTADLRTPLSLLLAVVVARAAVAWYTEVAANRSSSRVKSQLRQAFVEKVAETAQPGDRQSVGELATLATHGIDALDGYFSRYLPQLVLAVIVPVTVIVAVAATDWISAATVAVTVPLIPVFMALIGLRVRTRQDRQLRTLQVLSGHFLDVVRGLATLKVFGRSKAQVEAIRAVTDSYRRTTMSTLRLAFLSSLVLELVASVAVALVAVEVGLRLLHGHLDLQSALFVLVLAPEAYLPLRMVGTSYHASAEGLSAADQMFAVLERPSPFRGERTDVPDPATHVIEIDRVTASYPDRPGPVVDECTFTIEPGEVVALAGPSGSGKTTALKLMLGFVAPQTGTLRIGGVDLATLDPDAWRARIAWMPQHPHLFAGTIAENLRLGRIEATQDELWHALVLASLAERVAELPQQLDTPLGERGTGLSAGERQRVALARALIRDAPLLLLDEPTAHLDRATEARVIDSLRRVAVGRSVVVVAHRAALLDIAHRVVECAPATAVR